MEQLILEGYMELNRTPTKTEKNLIGFLIKQSSKESLLDCLDTILVCPMNDGGMGSILIFNKDDEPDRVFGEQISECYFVDEDGVDVVVSLNVDNKGNLFELDIWKINFSPVINLPDFGNFSLEWK